MLAINAGGILLYIASCVYILKKDKRIFIFFAFLTFSQTWALVSCFYNDIGIYNIELFRYTEPTYATFRLSMLYVVFNIGFYMVARIFQNRALVRVDYAWSKETLRLGPLKSFIYATVGLVIVYIAYSFYTGGIPVLSGFGKLSYFEEANRLERLLLLYGFLFSFILGFYRRKGTRFSINGVLLAIYILYLLLTGNKFSSLMLLLVCYFAPIFARYYFHHPDIKIFKARYIIVAFIVVVLLLGLAFVTYLHVSDNAAFASNYLLNRVLAFQGEMWWAIDYDYYHGDLYDYSHWKTELDAITSPGDIPSTDIGMKYLMIKVLGPQKAYVIIEKGYLYTMTYPGILIAMFPLWVAFIIQFFAGGGFFIVLFYFYYSVVYHHFFRALVSVLIIIPYIVVLFTGNLGVFFTFGMIIKIMILILLEMGAYRQNRSMTHV